MKTTLMICSRAAGVAAMICFLSGMTAAAGDPDPQDLQAQAERLQREARELKAQGKDEAAGDTMRQAEKLRAQAGKLQDRPDRQRAREVRSQLEKARTELKEAQAAANEEEALKARRRVQDLEMQLEGLERSRRPPRDFPGRDMPPDRPEVQRMRHLQVAIDNLHAAGMHDVADQLARQAEGLRQQLRPRELGRPGFQPGQDMERLRAELQELRQNVRELNRRVEELSGDRR